MQSEKALYHVDHRRPLTLELRRGDYVRNEKERGSGMKNAIAREKGPSVESKYFQWAAVHVALSALCSAQK